MNQIPKVFIPHDDYVWVAGDLISESQDGFVEVRINDSDINNMVQPILKLDLKNIKGAGEPLVSLPLQNIDMPIDGVDDMCTLSYLHEPSILDNLRRYDYKIDVIF